MLKKLIPSLPAGLTSGRLEVYVDSDWGSSQRGHREKIRAALEDQLLLEWTQEVSAAELLKLKDLKVLPGFKKVHVSISHGQNLGGFAISNRPVGFDIELKDRAQEKIVRRISLERELLEAPSLAQLWTAKESAFKALRAYAQPGVISEIEIGGWNQDHFKLLNELRFKAPSGQGTTWFDENNVFSIFRF